MSGISTGRGRYCELHAHSCFSLLDGVPFPAELAARAAELGLDAIALTDHDALYGMMPFFAAAQAAGLRAIAGAEITLDDGAHLTLLAETQAGYRSLCSLITQSRADRPKGSAGIGLLEIGDSAAGLLCLTGCRQGRVAQRLLAREYAGAQAALDDLLGLFGRRNVYVEVQRHLRRDDVRLSRRLADLAAANGLKLVATGNVHYLTRADADLQDVLVSARERVPLVTARRDAPAQRDAPLRRDAPLLRPNHEYSLRSPAAMRALYPDLPQAVTNTLEVAERCQAAPPSGLQVLPAFPAPAGLDAPGYLRALCEQALPRLYPRQAAEARALLAKELGLIERLGLANYFLIVWDIVRFCRERGILCHGRGSAANSLVARLLGISAVDPIAQKLVVERFLSVEHGGTPDIDLDIDAARRETVIQYIYERWGRDHAAMACTYVTFRSASALRDVAFALGLQKWIVESGQWGEVDSGQRGEVDSGQRIVDSDAAVDRQPKLNSLRPEPSSSPTDHDPLTTIHSSLVERLKGRPRHLGIHNGGMIITGEPIAGLIPVEPATMEARTVVQWDKESLEQAGIVKIDLLGLRMLSAIADTLLLVQRERGHTDEMQLSSGKTALVMGQSAAI